MEIEGVDGLEDHVESEDFVEVAELEVGEEKVGTVTMATRVVRDLVVLMY